VHNSEDHSSYEIFNSAIGELSKQNLNNSQYIDQIGKKQLISGGWGEGGDKNMTLASITEESQKLFQVSAMLDPDTVAQKTTLPDSFLRHITWEWYLETSSGSGDPALWLTIPSMKPAQILGV
jgi:hypothetical protein